MKLRRTLGAIALIVLACLIAPTAQAADHAALERQFEAWIVSDVWPEAERAGVARNVFDAAFAGVTLDWKLPDLAPPSASEGQAEFRSPAAYFDAARIEAMVRTGRLKLKEWSTALAAIEKHYGVPAPVIVAIWGRESGFGAATLSHSAIRVLATGAFLGRRKDLFRSELIAALKILQAGDVKVADLTSSWAGALGQPQMMPSQFLRYAVDFDGDGRRDIWTSVPDSLASIAGALSAQGWDRKRNWSFEIELPAAVACSLDGPDQGKPIADWAGLGVKRKDGTPLPQSKLVGFLLMPAGRFGPAFLVSQNFYTLKAYNNSDLYALYILHLADRFSDDHGFVAPWGDIGHFTRASVAAMQKRLQAEGYDVGGTDGLVGYKTRIAVGKWQAKAGKPVTCYPDAAMLADAR